MADEPIVSTPAPGAGGDGGGAPAGGGDGGGAPAAPQTDESILGIDPVGTSYADEPEKPADAPAADPAKPAADPTKPAAPDATKTPEQLAAEKLAEDAKLPEKWRELAKNDPEFRNLFFAGKAAQEKLAQLEPKVTELQNTVQAVERADQAYLSGDPTAIRSELSSFLADKPEALIPMYQAGEQLLKELHPQEYARLNDERVNATLKDWKFDQVFAVLRSAIDKGDDGLPLLRSQVEKMLEFADKGLFPTTEAARVAARARELDTREAGERATEEQRYNASAVTFKDAVNSTIETTVKAEIKTGVAKLLEKAAFTDGAKARIEAEAFTEINKLLAAKPEIVDQIGKAIWPNGSKGADGKPVRGNWSKTNQELAIRIPTEHAKTVLADVLKKVIDQYTTDFMASQKTADKRMAAAASKTEVSGGAPAPRGSKPLSKKDVDYSKMSDDDILEA